VVKAGSLVGPEQLRGSKSQVASLSVPEIVRRIQILESSGGKNNYSKCEKIGKYNNYGYGIYGEKYQCFEKGEDTKTVEKWVKDKLDNGYKIEELACYYNEGLRKMDCDYSKKLINLN